MPARVEVRFGRQIRTTRPRLTVSARLDLRQLGFPTVVMRVETNARGDVISAEIHRSSGSGEVDLNWAREHHDLWVAEEERKLGRQADPGSGQPQPAE